jgi:hypothetical protein
VGVHKGFRTHEGFPLSTPLQKRARELLELIKEEPAEMDDWTNYRAVT